MKRLVVMRGASGSGKSTKAKQLAADYLNLYGAEAWIFSTDEFFMRDGQYMFNPAALGHAHCWNQLRAIQAMIQGVS